MPLIILPKNTGPDSSQEAQAKLKAEIEDPYSAVMIINGEGPDVSKAIEMCTARAALNPLRRRVIWVPDITVLTDEQRQEYAPSGIAGVVIGLDDKVAATLTAEKAKVRIYIEEAFTKGGG